MKTVFYIAASLFCLLAKGQTAADSNSNSKEWAGDSVTFAQYNPGDTVVFTYKNGFVSEAQKMKYTNNECKARGIVMEKKEHTFLIKVRLVEGCDKQGIIAYEAKNIYLKNRRTGESEKASGQRIYMKPRKELWFRYSDWEILK